MKKIINSVFVTSLILFPVFVLAQAPTNNPPPPTNTPPVTGVIDIRNPTTAGSTLMDVLNTLLRNVVMPIAAIAVVMYIIWAGFSFVTAQGKPAEIEKAKQRLLWALIGAGILLGATGISLVVERTVRALFP